MEQSSQTVYNECYTFADVCVCYLLLGRQP